MNDETHTYQVEKLAVAAKLTLAMANELHPQHLQGLRYTLKIIEDITLNLSIKIKTV